MMNLSTAMVVINLLGLLLTVVGASIAAWAVIISDERAAILSGAYFGGNNALRAALMAQSRHARNGLLCIVVGTLLQAASVAIPLVY